MSRACDSSKPPSGGARWPALEANLPRGAVLVSADPRGVVVVAVDVGEARRSESQKGLDGSPTAGPKLRRSLWRWGGVLGAGSSLRAVLALLPSRREVLGLGLGLGFRFRF